MRGAAVSALPSDEAMPDWEHLPPEQRAFPENTDAEEHARRAKLSFADDLKSGKLFQPTDEPPPTTQAGALLQMSKLAKRTAELELEKEKVRAEAVKVRAGVIDGPARPPGTLQMRTADTMSIESVWWLWGGHLACSFLNLVVGETGAGKSTVLADVAARVTTGAPFPGETAWRMPGRVLWLGSEDPFEIVTLPRLLAAGADTRMVTEIQAVQRMGKMDAVSMQDDIGAVKAELMGAKQFGGAYAMLVIDPITSYLHGGKLRKVDMNDSGQLRTILEPWTRLAKDTGIALVGVTHLAKDTTRSMVHRVLGGGAFAQLCRSLLAVVNIPDAGDYEKGVMQVKTNLPGARKGGWRFETQVKVVGYDAHQRPVNASFPNWLEFDHSLTPESIAGGARGPVSKNKEPIFRMWLDAQFVGAGEEWLPVTTVRNAALANKVCTLRSWDDLSRMHLAKRNVNGTWECSLKRNESA